jgi:hypothetical protein
MESTMWMNAGENVLDVLGRDLLATAVDEALDAPGEEQVPVLVQ